MGAVAQQLRGKVCLSLGIKPIHPFYHWICMQLAQQSQVSKADTQKTESIIGPERFGGPI